MSSTDKELIILAQKGDSAAFEKLVFQYDRTVLSIAKRYVQDDDEAKDLYQEVFIRVFRGIKNFRFQSEFSTWLYRITTNVCITHIRKVKEYQISRLRMNYNETDNEDRGENIVYDGLSPEEEAIGSDIGEILDFAVESLSPKQKITFVLKHYEGYKIREIAEMLNCKEGTVKKYLFDAVKNLRKKLRPIYIYQT